VTNESTIFMAEYEGHPLRFIRGPRFNGDLPWWVVDDVADCIAGLLGRDVSGLIGERILEACPAEDQVIIAIVGPDAVETTATAAAEVHLAGMIFGLMESDAPELAAFGRWFRNAAPAAREAVGGTVANALGARGISYEDES